MSWYATPQEFQGEDSWWHVGQNTLLRQYINDRVSRDGRRIHMIASDRMVIDADNQGYPQRNCRHENEPHSKNECLHDAHFGRLPHLEPLVVDCAQGVAISNYTMNPSRLALRASRRRQATTVGTFTISQYCRTGSMQSASRATFCMSTVLTVYAKGTQPPAYGALALAIYCTQATETQLGLKFAVEPAHQAGHACLLNSQGFVCVFGLCHHI